VNTGSTGTLFPGRLTVDLEDQKSGDLNMDSVGYKHLQQVEGDLAAGILVVDLVAVVGEVHSRLAADKETGYELDYHRHDYRLEGGHRREEVAAVVDSHIVVAGDYKGVVQEEGEEVGSCRTYPHAP
jgi:hypothetical protein